MKKLSIILVLIMLVGLFSSCMKVNDDMPENLTEYASDTVPESKTEDVTDTLPVTENVEEIQQLIEFEKRADKFSFSFTVEKTEYHPGDDIYLYAKVTNVSEEDHVYTGSSSAFMASLILYWQTESGEIGGELKYDPVPWAEDIRTHTIKNGGNRTTMYRFRLPDDVKGTSYTVLLSYNSESVVFEDVISITMPEASN